MHFTSHVYVMVFGPQKILVDIHPTVTSVGTFCYTPYALASRVVNLGRAFRSGL